MSEKWEQFYTQDELKTLQHIEIENLKVFISVCEKLQLQYIVYGGTLLGAELYQGMIPWDDDVDVAMPRSDYEKFCEQASLYLPDDCFIQNPYNTPNCPYSYTKLRRRGTKYVEYANRNVKIETGIYIDIYPIDCIPDSERKRKKQFKKVRKWQMIFVCRQVPLYDKKAIGIKDNILKIVKWVICKSLKVFSAKYCIHRIDYYMTLYNGLHTKRHAVLTSPKYNNIYLHLFPFDEMKFEELMVKVPGDAKTHLKMRYGDYERTLSDDEKFGHVPYKLDLGDWL